MEPTNLDDLIRLRSEHERLASSLERLGRMDEEVEIIVGPDWGYGGIIEGQVLQTTVPADFFVPIIQKRMDEIVNKFTALNVEMY